MSRVMPEAPHLGELEAAIMEVIWRRARATVRDVLGALRRSPAPGYTTVATIMNRLVEKGLLRREREGRLDVYHPTYDRAEFERRTAATAVRGLVDAYGTVALAQFAAALEDADPDLLARLRARVARSEGDADA
jgi:predicted transcriptional regulator